SPFRDPGGTARRAADQKGRARLLVRRHTSRCPAAWVRPPSGWFAAGPGKAPPAYQTAPRLVREKNRKARGAPRRWFSRAARGLRRRRAPGGGSREAVFPGAIAGKPVAN